MTQPEPQDITAKPVTALILAGRRGGEHDRIAEHTGVALKAFAPINGRAMLSHVIDNCLACPAIDKIVIAMPGDIDPGGDAPDLTERLRTNDITCIGVGDSPAESVKKALYAPGVPAGRLAITTADHPLLTPAMISEFVANWQSDVGLGVVALDDLRAKFPEQRRTRLRFADGMYKGCNLFGLDTRGDGIEDLLAFWTKLERLRKRPLAMARAIGTSTAVLYALRLLSLNSALDHIGRRVGMHIQPICLSAPEAAIDVDRVKDLEFVSQQLADSSRDAA